MQPQVSIVLPTYNGSAYLRQAIQSILSQQDVLLELIIIDDASSDSTGDIVKSFADSRIQYTRLEKNGGHIEALNLGFAKAKGEHLTWTSDDNYYAPGAISKMFDVLKNNPSIDFVYSRYQIINPTGQPLRLGRTDDPAGLDVDNCVGGCFLYRRKVYEEIGDFDKNAFLAEDYEYWLRVRSKFRMQRLDQVLYFYREHEQSLTGVHKANKVLEQVEKIRDRFIPSWKKEYFHGLKALQQNKKAEAARLSSAALKANPFFVPSWRLWMVSHLPEGIVTNIRRIKHSLKG
jgi:glycosyltransferase involved in cell wall biosynthesis